MAGIGSQRRCASVILQQFGFAPFRGILSPEVFVTAAREADCAPKRQRPLIPEVVAWLMMYVGLQTTSMTQGLAQAWGLVRAVCPWLHQGCVSEEAFCQARKQRTIGFWRTLWEHLVRRFETTFAPAMLWKGTFRLLAIDSELSDRRPLACWHVNVLKEPLAEIHGELVLRPFEVIFAKLAWPD